MNWSPEIGPHKKVISPWQTRNQQGDLEFRRRAVEEFEKGYFVVPYSLK